MSGRERKEAADIAQLTSRVAQYEKRHQELMEHIASYLAEEDIDEAPQCMSVTCSPGPPRMMTNPNLNYSSCQLFVQLRFIHFYVSN